ncbi:MAG: cobalamin-dependent protein [Nitrospirae bacterium]|nr:cobalamin-dependent protein [Nitrospirota bacterium]
MPCKTDIVLINPGNRRQIYQELAAEHAAIEPPFLIASIASYLRNNNCSVQIIDANALGLTPEETASAVNEISPHLAAVIVYGSQPSASTQTMDIAGAICKALREYTQAKIAIGGLHPSALPERTLKEEAVDFVVDGEGPVTLRLLIEAIHSGTKHYETVPGLWYYEGGEIKGTVRPGLLRNIDELFPAGAWDMLPMDKYRAHNWHCFDNIDSRMPYAAIYTSLGCPYSCVFCCINAPFGKPTLRYRSPAAVAAEIRLLRQKYGVKNIKIIDELFIFNEAHYMKILEPLIGEGLDLNFWAYARIDSIKEKNLVKMKQAGVNWLALGIESAVSAVRDGVDKKIKSKAIGSVIREIHNAGIRVIGNYIFGLPDDTIATMEETLQMAVDLNCEFANFYCAMAYPGSRLYSIAVEEGWELPDKWSDFSQHSYCAKPLPTKYCEAKEVLAFRDSAFHRYFEGTRYLNMIEEKFGAALKTHITEMTKTRLKRKLLDEP